MATTKKEFGATDAAPVVLYGLKDASSQNAVPVLVTSTGTLLIGGSSRENKVRQQTTIASTTATVVLTSASAVFLDVYGCVVANTSASAAVVRFKDNTTLAYVIAVPAGETRGFMLPESGAMAAAAAGTQWTATLDSAVSSVEVTMLALKNS